jgi:hypothetical protein
VSSDLSSELVVWYYPPGRYVKGENIHTEGFGTRPIIWRGFVSDVDPLVAAFLIAGLFGSALFWFMKARVASTGIPVKYYSPEIRRILRFYRELAPSKGWSLWPIAGFWISLVATFVFGLIFSRSGHPNR